MKNILETLHKKRICIIENADAQLFENIIFKLGIEVLRSDIKIAKNPEALISSNSKIDWHQDSTEAKWIAWFCIDPGAEKSEYTEILPLDQIVRKFSLKQKAEFSAIKVKDRKSNGSETSRKLFDSETLYYCPWLVHETKKSAQPINELKKMIVNKESTSIQLSWSAGTILIIDNHWCMHRRPALTANSRRHLIRSWISERKLL